jgi:hypothetical protein
MAQAPRRPRPPAPDARGEAWSWPAARSPRASGSMASPQRLARRHRRRGQGQRAGQGPLPRRPREDPVDPRRRARLSLMARLAAAAHIRAADQAAARPARSVRAGAVRMCRWNSGSSLATAGPAPPPCRARPSRWVTGPMSRSVLDKNSSCAPRRSAGRQVAFGDPFAADGRKSSSSARVMPARMPACERRRAPHPVETGEQVGRRRLGDEAVVVAHHAIGGATAFASARPSTELR